MEAGFHSGIVIGILATLAAFQAGCATTTEPADPEPLPLVAEVDLSDYQPSDFATEEWYMPYYLNHFSRVANSVVSEGPNRGFIDITVWRRDRDNEPFNARIMESIVSLAWFYTQERSWNPYRGDAKLRARLEAALDFWCGMQREDGLFSEYSYERYTLAPTAFGTKFVGRALHMLRNDSSIDSGLYERALETWRKALYVSFTKPEMWTHGLNYTNQYANLWGGALMYLEIKDDPEIERLLKERMEQSMEGFQSPAGFFYEAGGPDWGYNLSTHHSDLQVAWHFAKEELMRDQIAEKTRLWYDWLSYNAVREPESGDYYLNRAIETRQQQGVINAKFLEDPARQRWTPQAEVVDQVRAFELSAEELAELQSKKHAEMSERFPEVDPLDVGSFRAFSPYAFVHEGLVLWHASESQKAAAIARLPYLASDRFTQLLYDPRSQTSYAYLRRPNFYLAYNAGPQVTEHQRLGLGLLWNPRMGAVVQSQSRSHLAAWGTRDLASGEVSEAGDVIASYLADGSKRVVDRNSEYVDTKTWAAEYGLSGEGRKSVSVSDGGIAVSVAYESAFEERIPLLLDSDDRLTIGSDFVLLENAKAAMRIEISGASAVRTEPVDLDYETKRCVVVVLPAKGELEYRISFTDKL